MFYERLKELCLARGISITALAVELGFSKGTPTRWKQGAVPNESTIKLFADYFGVSPSFLANSNSEKPALIGGVQNGNAVIGDNNVVGNHAQTLIVRNGEKHERVLSDSEVELLRVFNELDVKRQTSLLTFAFGLEEEIAYSMAARGTEGVVQIRDKKAKKAVDRAFDTADDE